MIDLFLYYPMISRSTEEIPDIAEMWLEDLGGMSISDFRAAVKLARKRSDFLPSVRQIIECHKEICNTPKTLEALPEPDGMTFSEFKKINPEKAKLLDQFLNR